MMPVMPVMPDATAHRPGEDNELALRKRTNHIKTRNDGLPAPVDLTRKIAFPPVIGPAPRLLILGSMPGEASLRLGRYYGHPRNAFWPIIKALLNLPAASDYDQCIAALCRHRMALWDVIAACERPGSLDAAIRGASIETNDFARLFARQPSLRCIAFNGGTAAEVYRRRVRPSLPPAQQEIVSLRLPSTSPAHAGRPFADKLAAWREALIASGVI